MALPSLHPDEIMKQYNTHRELNALFRNLGLANQTKGNGRGTATFSGRDEKRLNRDITSASREVSRDAEGGAPQWLGDPNVLRQSRKLAMIYGPKIWWPSSRHLSWENEAHRKVILLNIHCLLVRRAFRHRPLALRQSVEDDFDDTLQREDENTRRRSSRLAEKATNGYSSPAPQNLDDSGDVDNLYRYAPLRGQIAPCSGTSQAGDHGPDGSSRVRDSGSRGSTQTAAPHGPSTCASGGNSDQRSGSAYTSYTSALHKESKPRVGDEGIDRVPSFSLFDWARETAEQRDSPMAEGERNFPAVSSPSQRDAVGGAAPDEYDSGFIASPGLTRCGEREQDTGMLPPSTLRNANLPMQTRATIRSWTPFVSTSEMPNMPPPSMPGRHTASSSVWPARTVARIPLLHQHHALRASDSDTRNLETRRSPSNDSVIGTLDLDPAPSTANVNSIRDPKRQAEHVRMLRSELRMLVFSPVHVVSERHRERLHHLLQAFWEEDQQKLSDRLGVSFPLVATSFNEWMSVIEALTSIKRFHPGPIDSLNDACEGLPATQRRTALEALSKLEYYVNKLKLGRVYADRVAEVVYQLCDDKREWTREEVLDYVQNQNMEIAAEFA